MNDSAKDNLSDLGINRRQAIKRAALFLGTAVCASTLSKVMAADRSSLATGPNWNPSFLKKGQARIVSLAAELILPRSDTPGAQDVGVPQFIDLFYGEFMSDEESRRFDEGLFVFERAGFLDGSDEDRIALLKGATEASRGFIRHLRELTILGYFTSEEIARNVLRYDPIPGKFDGCVSVDEIGDVIMSEPR